jgi:hypothetical protein
MALAERIRPLVLLTTLASSCGLATSASQELPSGATYRCAEPGNELVALDNGLGNRLGERLIAAEITDDAGQGWAILSRDGCIGQLNTSVTTQIDVASAVSLQIERLARADSGFAAGTDTRENRFAQLAAQAVETKQPGASNTPPINGAAGVPPAVTPPPSANPPPVTPPPTPAPPPDTSPGIPPPPVTPPPAAEPPSESRPPSTAPLPPVTPLPPGAQPPTKDPPKKQPPPITPRQSSRQAPPI